MLNSSSPVPPSSSFTAINQHLVPSFTTQASSFVQQEQPRRRATLSTRRCRNPTVAQYLGLGYSDEPTHLEKYAPLLGGSRSPPPKPARKRRKVRDTNDPPHSMDLKLDTPSIFVERRVSEGLRGAKSSSLLQPSNANSTKSADGRYRPAPSKDSALEYAPSQTVKANTSLNAPARDSCSSVTYVSAIEKAVSGKPHYTNADDGYAGGPHSSVWPQVPDSDYAYEDDEFDDDLDDDEFFELTSDMIDTRGNMCSVSSSSSKVDHVPAVNRILESSISTLKETNEKKRSAKKFVSPMTLTTRLLAATGDIDCAEARKPIVRSPFPTVVRDRSPIIGLSADTLLRTCFRIGEAINQAHQSVKSGKPIVFELYARTLDSDQDDTKRYYTFCDLFHGKPPYIEAVYEGVLWKSVQLFAYDSKRLLQQGRICRCMGTMKRDGKEWQMDIMNIWEATWEDIKWAEGIVDA
jgi:hypothetical protein